MKRIYLVLLFVFCTGYLIAQQSESQNPGNPEIKTIFGGKKVGGYGAVSIAYSRINKNNAVTLGARGGVVLGRSLVIGIGTKCFVNTYRNDPALNRQINLLGCYGGFFAEPIIFPNSVVHLTFPVEAGLGGVAYTTWVKNGFSSNSSNVDETSAFMFIEPSVEIECNLVKFFRVSAYFSYRFTTPTDMQNISASALNNYAAGIMFKFGKF